MIRRRTKMVWVDGNSHDVGKVIDTFTPKPKNKERGNPWTENGNVRNKVLLIERADGLQLIKCENEVSRLDDPSVL